MVLKNERPIWLECGNCLFYEDNTCYFDRLLKVKPINDFCSEWKCRNCFGNYDSFVWEKDSDKEIYINHSKCDKVIFE